MINRSSRRTFLKRSLQVAGGTALPLIWTRRLPAGVAANDRPKLGCIGVGSRGTYISNSAAEWCDVVACADVDRDHAGAFAGHRKCKAYSDYRELLDRDDIDVVTVGTPDHWHAKVLLDALRAGKDVYCEKPMTLTIDEGKQICAAVRDTGRIVQVGTQQRSSGQFLMAVAMAQSGRLGNVLKATCYVGPGEAGGPFATADPPPQLDWDMWLGQARQVPYTPERCHGNFRWWLEYSGGKLTDWGAHHVDIAQWALGEDESGPVEIEGRGEFPLTPTGFDPVAFFAGEAPLPNGFNVPTTYEVTLRFASGSSLVVTDGPGNGILLEGEKGRVFVNRSRFSGKPVEELTDAERDELADQAERLYRGNLPDPWVIPEDDYTGIDQQTKIHMRHFLDRVRDRSQPVSDVFTHHRSVSSCHLANIAMQLGRQLKWDPQREDFVGDEQASALVARPQRAAYATSS